ncbi:hypothetical protein GCM10020331_101760 [Ectobacillus funiculus]
MYMLKYEQITIEIEKHIKDNALQQGDKLPVLGALRAHFEVSKSTITKSLDLLEKKRDNISSQRKRNFFVRRLKRKGYISLLTNLKWRG